MILIRLSKDPDKNESVKCAQCGTVFECRVCEARKLCSPECLGPYLARLRKGVKVGSKSHYKVAARVRANHASRRRDSPSPEVRDRLVREWILEMRHAARVEAGQ